MSSAGTIGDTAEVRYHFIEFLRLNLGEDSSDAKWFPISEPLRWKVHYKMKKVEDVNNLDGSDATDAIWINNGSLATPDNNGFNEDF